MVLTIIAVVMCVLGFLLAVLAAYAVEERTLDRVNRGVSSP